MRLPNAQSGWQDVGSNSHPETGDTRRMHRGAGCVVFVTEAACSDAVNSCMQKKLLIMIMSPET